MGHVSRSRARSIGIGVGVVLVTLVAALGAMMYLFNYWPAKLERVRVDCQAQAPALRPGERFRVVTWNIQFAGSRQYHFFYDGGRAVHASRSVVQHTLQDIHEKIRAARPDILLLQEVDRDSARTARIDELAGLRPTPPLSCWAATPYFKSRYIPAPLYEPLGRMDMDLVTASRFRMTWARRRALPLLRENVVRRAFNLKRAILEAAVAVQGRSRPLVLLNTHLSAFSKGDGTLQAQVSVIMKRLHFLDERGIPWILAGDFNMLPPGDNPVRLGDKAKLYADKGNPIEPLYRRYRSGVDPEAAKKDPARFYTYQRFGGKQAERRIDYFFVSDGVDIHDLRVLPEKVPASDHLRLVLEASVR